MKLPEGGHSRALLSRLILLWFLFAIPLAVLKAGNDYVIAPKAAAAVIGGIFAAAVLGRAFSMPAFFRQPLVPALAAWLAVCALAVIPAVNRAQALWFLAGQAGWIAAAAAALFAAPGRGKVVAVCAASLAVQLFVAILQLNDVWLVGHGEQFGPGRIYATLGNPSFFGVYLAPVGVLLLADFFAAARARARPVLFLRGAALAACLFLLFKAAVIDAWAGLALGGALAVWLGAGFPRRRAVQAAAVLGIGAVLGMLALAPRLGDRLDYLKTKAFSWHAAAWLLRERPVTGSGLGSYQSKAPIVMARVHEQWTKVRGAPETFVAPHDEAYAHQDFLQILAETGVIGFGIFIWLIATAVRAGRRLPGREAWLGALAAFVPTMAFHFPFYLAPSACMFWLCLAWAGRRGEPESEASNAVRFPSLTEAGGLVLAAAAAGFVARVLTAEVLLSKGYRLFLSGAPRHAARYFEKFESLNPNSYEERFFAGALHHELGDFARSIDSYERALALYPGMQGAIYNLGNVALSMRQYERAIGCYDRALGINPVMAEALNNRGNAYVMLGDEERGRADFLRAIELRPDYAEALYNLAARAYRAKDYREAWKWVERALKANPNYEPAQELAAYLARRGK